MKKSFLLCLSVLFAQPFLANEAFAVHAHTENISHSLAKELCKGHGGGTSCQYCHGDHCHSVGCNKKNSNECYNWVVPARQVGRSGMRPPRGVNAPPQTTSPLKGHHHPVNIGGLRAPSAGVKQSDRQEHPVTILRASKHHSETSRHR